MICDPNALVDVRKAIQDAGLDYDAAEVEFVPDFFQPVPLETFEKVEKLVDAIDDLDDVQNVYGNYEPDAEALASLAED